MFLWRGMVQFSAGFNVIVPQHLVKAGQYAIVYFVIIRIHIELSVIVLIDLGQRTHREFVMVVPVQQS